MAPQCPSAFRGALKKLLGHVPCYAKTGDAGNVQA